MIRGGRLDRAVGWCVSLSWWCTPRPAGRVALVWWALLLVLVLVSKGSPAVAGVNLKNGNFYVSYTDLVLHGPTALEITRTYNSKSTFEGMFGFGWGWDYATHVSVEQDGSLTVFENGGGATTVFAAGVVSDEAVDAAVERIVRAARLSRPDLDDPGTASAYRIRLREDREYRSMEGARYAKSGALQSPRPPVGTVLRSAQQRIIVTDSGFVRHDGSGKVEHFGVDGHLERVVEANGHHVELVRDARRRLKQIVDDSGHRIDFRLDDRGLVQEMATDDQVARYRYDARGDLVWSQDTAGNVFFYRYIDNHNLASIGYQNGETLQIAYHATGYTRRVVSRDGMETTYAYFDREAPGGIRRHGTRVTMTDLEGSVIRESSTEYFMKRRPDGASWASRVVTEKEGVRTDTVYNECCALPVRIEQNGRVTEFEYSDSGLLARKRTDSEETRLEYTATGKVGRVEIEAIGEPAPLQWFNYTYDKMDQLSYAEDHTGQSAKLSYDKKARIVKMESHVPGAEREERTLTFAYNDTGKPTRIELESVGHLDITYASDGELLKVDNSGGSSVALEVTRTFQQLLELVQPAGVSLSL